MNKIRLGAVHHVAIICSDYQRSKAFYTEVLNFKVLNETYREERDSYKLDLELENGDRIELFSFPAPPKRPSYPEACGLRHLAFAVDDIEKAVADLAAENVPVESVRRDPATGKRFAFFEDPDKLPLELYEK